MAQVSIRSIQHAEIRQPRHVDPIEGFGATLPDLLDRLAALAEDADRVHEFDGAEAGGEDDEVEVVGLVGGLDAGGGDGGDGASAEIYSRAGVSLGVGDRRGRGRDTIREVEYGEEICTT